MVKTKHEAARYLANIHSESEDGILYILEALSETADDREPVKLLEINKETVLAGILPVLGPSETPSHPEFDRRYSAHTT